MTVVISGEHPQVQELIQQRQDLGQDGHDEVWEGVYHVAPHAHAHHGIILFEIAAILYPHVKRRGLVPSREFNLGEGKSSYRVPDFGVHLAAPDLLYVPTALMVGEILSPDDETYAKFDYYATHGVSEIVVVDPAKRSVLAYRLTDDAGYVRVDDLACAGITCLDLESQINWP
jgi:Uma2 family endonuclease